MEKLALAWSARLAVAGILGVAAVSKLLDPAKFAQMIVDYQAFPLAWTNAMAYVIPVVELVSAAWLLTGPHRGDARALLAIMLVAFTALKIVTELRGLKISCGCFGGGALAWLEKALEGWRGIAFNVALLALLLADHALTTAARRRREPRITVESTA